MYVKVSLVCVYLLRALLFLCNGGFNGWNVAHVAPTTEFSG